MSEAMRELVTENFRKKSSELQNNKDGLVEMIPGMQQ